MTRHPCVKINWLRVYAEDARFLEMTLFFSVSPFDRSVTESPQFFQYRMIEVAFHLER